MIELQNLLEATPEQVELIDHRTVEWGGVRLSRYWMHQRLNYAYPGPIRELRQRLMVVPPDHYGNQFLRAFHIDVSAPSSTSSSIDAFGNRKLHIYAPEADGDVTFDIRLVVDRDLSASTRVTVSPKQVETFLLPTTLTIANARISAIAHELCDGHEPRETQVEAINSWVYQTMKYGSGTTSVKTSAAEALEIGQGLCQDYSHLMIAICRAAGIPARYVSGHMLGEGGSHAWVEVLLPAADGRYDAIAFDPTNHRRATPAYITIAVGRDYSDVSPTQGSFVAPYSGALTASKRAGLAHIDWRMAC